jgi:hypothetical protein
MPTWLPAAFKVALTLAALAATPVTAWIYGSETGTAVAGFISALVTLFLKPPGSGKKDEPAPAPAPGTRIDL